MKARLQNGFGILLILSFFGYAFFSSLSRKQFLDNLLVYALLFLAFYGLYWVAKKIHQQPELVFPKWLSRWTHERPQVIIWLLAGVVLRLVFLWDTPKLSQDFFRFIWDGHMLLNGFNPYLYLPDELITNGAGHIPQAKFLHASMGELSSGHYTNYPPLNQLFFAASAFLGGKSILANMVWMRVFIILADVGIFVFGLKLLRILGKPDLLILLYFLNPFVIIELTGNLHWEGVMACLMLIGVYHFICYDRWRSPIYLSLGILLKLLPVIAVPLMLKRWRWKRTLLFLGTIGLVVVLGFLPFLSIELIQKYGASVGLWFGTFEFNASIYYVIRAIGFYLTGYNIIGTVGKILPVITFLIILLLGLVRKNQYPDVLLESILFSFFTYLLLSTTVHPWYLTIPLLFSLFTKYRFMLLWSFLVFLSYIAYSNNDFAENLWLVALEYILVIGYFTYEILFKSRKKNLKVAS